MKLLKKLKTWARWVPHHIKCGRHSGFRACDIFFYIFVWRIAWLFDAKWFFAFYASKFNTNTGYIPCPVCILLKRRLVRVRKCKC